MKSYFQQQKTRTKVEIKVKVENLTIKSFNK